MNEVYVIFAYVSKKSQREHKVEVIGPAFSNRTAAEAYRQHLNEQGWDARWVGMQVFPRSVEAISQRVGGYIIP